MLSGMVMSNSRRGLNPKPVKPATRRGWTSKSRPDKAAKGKPVPPKPTDALVDSEGALVRKNGRPWILGEIDQAKSLLAGLGAIQATWVECAAVLGISQPTLSRLFKRWPECKDAYEDGKAGGLTSLRRNQFKMAEKNATMAIFLGMNYLDQKDMRHLGGKVQHDHQGSVIGLLLKEIDSESRRNPMIDVSPSAGAPAAALPGPNDIDDA